MRITSSQQASGVELNGALRVYNMASGPAKQLHTAGGQFLLSTERKERGDRGMRPQSWLQREETSLHREAGIWAMELLFQVHFISCIRVTKQALENTDSRNCVIELH